MIEIKRKKQPVGSPVEGVTMPAEGADTLDIRKSAPGAQPAPKRELKPFTAIDTSRDYRALYRIAFAYHERNNPPRPGREYWDAAAEDIMDTALAHGNDPFLLALLAAVYEELEREYKKIVPAN